MKTGEIEPYLNTSKRSNHHKQQTSDKVTLSNAATLSKAATYHIKLPGIYLDYRVYRHQRDTNIATIVYRVCLYYNRQYYVKFIATGVSILSSDTASVCPEASPLGSEQLQQGVRRLHPQGHGAIVQTIPGRNRIYRFVLTCLWYFFALNQRCTVYLSIRALPWFRLRLALCFNRI